MCVCVCVCTDCVRGKRYSDGSEWRHCYQEWHILSWTSCEDNKVLRRELSLKILLRKVVTKLVRESNKQSIIYRQSYIILADVDSPNASNIIVAGCDDNLTTRHQTCFDNQLNKY